MIIEKGILKELNLGFEIDIDHNEICIYSLNENTPHLRMDKAIKELEELLTLLKDNKS
jgi:hypothetical protein